MRGRVAGIKLSHTARRFKRGLCILFGKTFNTDLVNSAGQVQSFAALGHRKQVTRGRNNSQTTKQVTVSSP